MTIPHRKLIFVCSPFRANERIGLSTHISYAKQACRTVFEEGNIPFAPHLLYPCFLSDAHPGQRQQGIDAGLAVLARCDELHVFEDYGISSGMEAEILVARALPSMPVVFRNLFPVSPTLEEKSSQSQKTY